MTMKPNPTEKALKTLGKHLGDKLAAKYPPSPALIEQATKAFEAAGKGTIRRKSQVASNPRAAAFSDQLQEVLSKVNDSFLGGQIEGAVRSFNLGCSSGEIRPESLRAEVLEKFTSAIQQCWTQTENAPSKAGSSPAQGVDKEQTQVKEKLSEERILEIIDPASKPFRLAGEDALMQRIAKILHDWVVVEIPNHPEVDRHLARGKVRAHKRDKTSAPKATH